MITIRLCWIEQLLPLKPIDAGGGTLRQAELTLRPPQSWFLKSRSMTKKRDQKIAVVVGKRAIARFNIYLTGITWHGNGTIALVYFLRGRKSGKTLENALSKMRAPKLFR